MKKPRGSVASGKRQVNWRIDERRMRYLEAEAKRRGFNTVPALVNTILAERYPGE